jgi:hypothetical protein
MRKVRKGLVKSLNYFCLAGVVALGFMAVLATGCGGGGGGGGGGGTPGISYSGLTTQASIDENNAEDLSTGALIGYTAGSGIPIGAVQSDRKSDIKLPLNLRLPKVLEEGLYRLAIGLKSSRAVASVSCESETFDGDCGGSAYGYLCVDDVSGFFDGYFIFSSYCSEGVTIDGRANFSGTVDVITYEFLEFSLSLEDVTVLSGGYSFTLAGTIDYDFTSSPVAVTIDMLLSDDSNGKVYWVNDYTVSLTEGSGYSDVEISGRYYYPDYGYVIVTTAVPLRIYDGDDWPSDGELIVTGADSTSAKLIALSSSTYRVEADTDGDGVYEWDSGVLYW